MKLLIFCLMFYLLSALFAVIIIIFAKKHEQATSGIINTDTFMRKFVFKVHLTRDEIISALAMRNVNDELLCYFNTDQSCIQFSEYNSNREYFYTIQSVDGYSILYFSQIALIGSKSSIPYKINPFIIKKLDAELVPFSKFEKLFRTQ